MHESNGASNVCVVAEGLFPRRPRSFRLLPFGFARIFPLFLSSIRTDFFIPARLQFPPPLRLGFFRVPMSEVLRLRSTVRNTELDNG